MGKIILLPRLTTPLLIVTPIIKFLYFYSQVVPYSFLQRVFESNFTHDSYEDHVKMIRFRL